MEHENLHPRTWGDVIVCEDGSGTDTLVDITPKGQSYKLERNAMSGSEMAEALFSLDGSPPL